MSSNPSQINALADLTVQLQLGQGTLSNGDQFIITDVYPGKFSPESTCTVLSPATTLSIFSCVFNDTKAIV